MPLGQLFLHKVNGPFLLVKLASYIGILVLNPYETAYFSLILSDFFFIFLDSFSGLCPGIWAYIPWSTGI